MPATAIHQSVTKILVKKLNINDELFFVGNIAPDCWRHSPLHKNKYESHFTTHICLNNQLAKIEDYKAFAYKYKEILSNPLVLGYLTHLMTDYWWKIYIVSKYVQTLNGKTCVITKNGEYVYENTKEFLSLNNARMLHKYVEEFNLEKIPHIDTFQNPIIELDPSGLNKTIDHVNNVNFKIDNTPNEIYNEKELINAVYQCADYIVEELPKLM